MGCGWTVRGSKQGGGEILLESPRDPHILRAMGTGPPSQGTKQLGSRVNYPPPSSKRLGLHSLLQGEIYLSIYVLQVEEYY